MTGLVLLLLASGLCWPVVISEVMFHPESGASNSEFVEIVNISDTAVNLTGWFLADLSEDHPDTLLGDRMLLQPGAYAVVLEGDYIVDGGAYWDLIPETALLLFVDDNLIGHYLNDSGDALFLIKSSGDTVDIMSWDQDITPGYSLEKVILDDCTLPGNWRAGTWLHGTPGGPNSVVGQEIDLGLDTLDWQAGQSPRGFNITATIHNYGLVAAAGELLATGTDATNVPTLAVGASTAVTFEWEAPANILGLYSLTVSLRVAGDYDTTNNSLQVELPIAAPGMAVVVNEIMYTPPSGDPEWVELVNTTESSVNLKDWQLCDRSDSVSLPEQTLPSGDYVVITGNSTGGVSGWPPGISIIVVPGFPALNNTGDQVSLLGPTTEVIDQVDYGLFALTTEGRSLEKVSPTAPSQGTTSWVTSPAPRGHTAGRENSVLLPPGQSGVALEPNPLQLNTPASILAVKYVTPFSAINLVVEIYDLAGRRLGVVFNEGPVPGTWVVTWDASSLDPVRYRTGQYVLLFRARDAGSGQRWERMERLILVK